MIYRKNNIFDKVKDDYNIPVETVTEKCDMDIEKIRKNVFDQIGIQPKKTHRKRHIFIILAAAFITVGAVGAVAVNGSKPVPIEPVWLESDEYNDWISKNSNIPRVLNVPMPSDEEKVIIAKIQDEYVDLYQSALHKYPNTLYVGEANMNAHEDVVKSLFERTSNIFEKYNYGSFDENDDIIQIINICCNAMDNKDMTVEEKFILKFFVRQIYEFIETGDERFCEYVREKMELTFIPFIDIYTAHSYEKDIYYINIEKTEEESSR